MSTAINSKYSRRHIERRLDAYDVGELVGYLRGVARSNWQTMHAFRRQANAAQNALSRGDAERMELFTRRSLGNALEALNAGLGREGSYRATFFRRIDRELKAGNKTGVTA